MDNSIEEITANIERWTAEHMKNDFEFRPYQLESIAHQIDNIVNDKFETSIIEAPTGSGKSLICLITAGVLNEYYDMNSYILCSDLYLWDQYAQAIQRNNLPFGYIKGAKNNYSCNVTGSPDITTGGDCVLKNKSYNSFLKEGSGPKCGFDCAEGCEYVLAKRRAMRTGVTLMTYQLWLKYMNFTEGETFRTRKVVFCDECHNIPSIVQMFCQPTINNRLDFRSMLEVAGYAMTKGLGTSQHLPYHSAGADSGLFRNIFNLADMEREMNEHFDFMYGAEYTNIDEILDHYNSMYAIVKSVAVAGEAVLAHISSKNLLSLDSQAADTNGKKPKKAQTSDAMAQAYVRHCERVEDMRATMSFFLHSVLGDNREYFVKNQTEVFTEKSKSKSISFASSKEDAIIHRYLLSHAPYKVLLSATVGGKNAFDMNIGVHLTQSKVSEMVRIPSTFDFSRSPIYTFGRDYSNISDPRVPELIKRFSMTYNVINQNLPNMVNTIIKIITSPRHRGERGFIHTGSYKNAQLMYDMLPDELKNRVLLYRNAKDKQDIIDKYLSYDNKIIAGPTLTEGIDFPNDGCRFQIIMKVPYPSLGDRLVDSKMRLYPGWYDSETSNKIIQSVGRGNRTPDDYSITYILDSGFYNLYKRTLSQYAPEFRQRIKLLNNI